MDVPGIVEEPAQGNGLAHRGGRTIHYALLGGRYRRSPHRLEFDRVAHVGEGQDRSAPDDIEARLERPFRIQSWARRGESSARPYSCRR
jgi:hypothetical protein